MKKTKWLSLLLSASLITSTISFVPTAQAADTEYIQKTADNYVSPNKTWTVTFSSNVDPDSVNEQTVFVEDSNGVIQDITLNIVDKKKIKVSAPKIGYEAGETYKLYVMELKSSSGKILKKNMIHTFTIEPEKLHYEITASSKTVYPNNEIELNILGNRNFKNLNWTSDKGKIVVKENKYYWQAPSQLGAYTINVNATTTLGEPVIDAIQIEVSEPKFEIRDESYIDDENDKTTDTDQDGLTDYDELNKYMTNPSNPDTDYDGISDYEEIQKGTDPNKANNIVSQKNALPELDLDIQNQFDIVEDSLGFQNSGGFGYYEDSLGGLCFGMAMVPMLNSINALPKKVLANKNTKKVLKDDATSSLVKNLKENDTLYDLSKDLLFSEDSRKEKDSLINLKQTLEIEKAVSYWWAMSNEMESTSTNKNGYFQVRSQVHNHSNYLLDEDIKYLINLFNSGLPTIITMGRKNTRKGDYSGHAVVAYGMIHKQLQNREEYRLLIYDNNRPYKNHRFKYNDGEEYAYIALEKNDGEKVWNYKFHVDLNMNDLENYSANKNYNSRNNNWKEDFSYFRTDKYLADLDRGAEVDQVLSFSNTSNTLNLQMSGNLTDTQIDKAAIYNSQRKKIKIENVEAKKNTHASDVTFKTYANNLDQQDIVFSYPVYIQNNGLPSNYESTLAINRDQDNLGSLTGQWKLVVGNTNKRYSYDNNIFDLTEDKNHNIRGTSYISLNNIRYTLPVEGKRDSNGNIELKEYWNKPSIIEDLGTPSNIAQKVVAQNPSNILSISKISDSTYKGKMQNLTWNFNKNTGVLNYVVNYGSDTIQLINTLDSNDKTFVSKSININNIESSIFPKNSTTVSNGTY